MADIVPRPFLCVRNAFQATVKEMLSKIMAAPRTT